jgi:hypothetical protein
MKTIEGVNIHNLEIVIIGTKERSDIDLGVLTLSLDDRNFMLNVAQSYSDVIEDLQGNPIIRINCELEVDEDIFEDCSYNITKEDLLNSENNNLVKTLYIGGDNDFEVQSIVLHFEIDGEYQKLSIDEE